MSHAQSDEVLSAIRSASKAVLLASGNTAYLELFEENARLRRAILVAAQELLASHNYTKPPEGLSPESLAPVPTALETKAKAKDDDVVAANSEDIHKAVRVEPGETGIPQPPAESNNYDPTDIEDDPQLLRVQDWRSTLQRTFLRSKSPAKAEVMPKMDELFTMLEAYDEMTIAQLKFSKIGKVMRHVAALGKENYNPIPPRDEEFKFRARAERLVEKWFKIWDTQEKIFSGPNANTHAAGADAHGAGKVSEDIETEGKSEGTDDVVTPDLEAAR